MYVQPAERLHVASVDRFHRSLHGLARSPRDIAHAVSRLVEHAIFGRRSGTVSRSGRSKNRIRLLRQPGGFEGFRSVSEYLALGGQSLAEPKHLPELKLGVSAAAPAACGEPESDHESVVFRFPFFTREQA